MQHANIKIRTSLLQVFLNKLLPEQGSILFVDRTLMWMQHASNILRNIFITNKLDYSYIDSYID